MKILEQEQSFIRRYLLGEMQEAERERLEERFITDPEYQEAVLLVEDELVEDYVAGLLPGGERERFEAHYLSTPHQTEKVRAAQALREHAQRAGAPRPAQGADETRTGFIGRLRALLRRERSGLSLAFAVLLLMALAGGIWWGGAALRQRGARAALARELAELNGPQSRGVGPGLPSAAVQPVTLTPVLVRDTGGAQRVAVSPATRVVQLRLAVAGGDYAEYRAELSAVGGADAPTVGGLRAVAEGGGRHVILNLPARLLSRGDYQVKLSGVSPSGAEEEVGDYSFRVLETTPTQGQREP